MLSFHYNLVTDYKDLPKLAESIASASVIGFDIETTALNPRDGEIRLMQFNIDGKITIVDLFQTRTAEILIKAIRDSKAIWVIHQAKFEQKWLMHKYKCELWPLFDSWRADVLIHNGKKEIKHSLYDVWSRYLGKTPQTSDQQKTDWSGPLSQEQYDYAAEDVAYLLDLRTEIKKALAQDGLNTVALIEFGVVLAEAEVELNGFPFDKEAWLALAKYNTEQAELLRKQLIHELPSPTAQTVFPGFDPDFNLDSNQQVLLSLQKLGLKSKVKDKETGRTMTVPLVNTAEMTLAAFGPKYPLVGKLLKYREHAQRVKMFGPEYLKYVRPDTGRIHPEYFPFTGAGRYSCNRANLQQIPRDKLFRKCFRAPDGRILIFADYAGIEMRLVAEVANDPALIEVFRLGQDAHLATASIIMQKAIDMVTKEERQYAKPVNFGFIYGLMPAKLVLYALANYGVVLTEAQAKLFRDRYFERYAGIARWHRKVQREGQRSHIVRTLSGRIRYMAPDAYNEYYNGPIQGLGADGLKRSLRIVNQRLKRHSGRAMIVHHVHDEIIVEADDDPLLIEAVKEDLRDGMVEGMGPFLQKVPIVVEPSSGADWSAK